MGGKGGVGKTGDIVALAEWFAANEIPVTLLDLDTENKARGSLKHFFNGTVTKVNIHTRAGLDAFVDHLDGGAAIILADMGAGAGRVSALPSELRAGLDPKEIARMLGESLRHHFLQSGVQDTVKAQQATSAAMTSAQKELSTALRSPSDSKGGVAAQVERANNRLECSLDSRAKTFDVLLHQWKSDLPRIWIPLIAGAAMLIGLFGGMEIQGCRDSATAVPPTSPRAAMQVAPPPEPPANGGRSAVRSISAGVKQQRKVGLTMNDSHGSIAHLSVIEESSTHSRRHFRYGLPAFVRRRAFVSYSDR
jgi:hypothetical protein